MRYWIFSYGSLAHKEVAGKTGKTLNHLPAVLRDHLRNFRALSKTGAFAAAGIEEKKGAETMGMLVEIPEEELSKFDQCEYLYERREISPNLIRLVQGEMPEGRFYVYFPKNSEAPTESFPLVQSYLDVVLEAFMEFDELLALRWLQTTMDMDRPWVDDRNMPRYSRYSATADVRAIDDLLERQVPQHLGKRKQDPKAVRVRPGLVEAMMKAIVFFDLFDFPLTAEEVLKYLYKYRDPVHIKEVEATLNYLAETRGLLAAVKGYYVLAGREAIVETRKSRKFIAEKFWTRTKLYGTYMKKVPFVEMIAVCNNLAYDNPSEQSDIDLFIVVKPGRMWLARFIITIILHFYGVRRYGDKVAGRFCLSFFVTDEKLKMAQFELKPEDPYLAYWTKNLRPIYGESVYQKFREQNEAWLEGYGLRFDESYKRHMYHEQGGGGKRFWQWLLGGAIGDLFENLLKHTLKKRTLRRMSELGPEASVIVSDDILKFHNHDKRQEFLKDWQKRMP